MLFDDYLKETLKDLGLNMNDYFDVDGNLIDDEDIEDDNIIAHIDLGEDLDDPDITKLFFACIISGTKEEICFQIWDHCEGWGCFDFQSHIVNQANSGIDRLLENGNHTGFIFIKMTYFDGDTEDQVEKLIRFQVEIKTDDEINIGDKLRCLYNMYHQRGTMKPSHVMTHERLDHSPELPTDLTGDVVLIKKGSIVTVCEVQKDVFVKLEEYEDTWFDSNFFEKVLPIKENAKDFLDSISEEM